MAQRSCTTQDGIGGRDGTAEDRRSRGVLRPACLPITETFPVPKVKRRGYAKDKLALRRALEEVTWEFNRGSALPEALCNELLRFHEDLVKKRDLSSALVNLVHRFICEGARVDDALFEKTAGYLRDGIGWEEKIAGLPVPEDARGLSTSNVKRLYDEALKVFRNEQIEHEQARRRA